MIELGMHTDNWRTLSGNFRTAVESAVKHGLSHIEFGVIHWAVLRPRPGIRSVRLAAIESPRPEALPGRERAAGLADRRAPFR